MQMFSFFFVGGLWTVQIIWVSVDIANFPPLGVSPEGGIAHSVLKLRQSPSIINMNKI